MIFVCFISFLLALLDYRDKFEVAPESVPYLAALISVSEEVQSRCHLKHRLMNTMTESASTDSISAELMQHQVSVCMRVHLYVCVCVCASILMECALLFNF